MTNREPDAGNPLRILCIEDDAVLSRLLQRVLQQAGYTVEIAGNGREGLAMVDSSSFDLLLVDYQMPGLSGLEVIRSLGERKGSPPAIMLTGGGSEQVAVEAMRLGAAEYLIKDAGRKYLELLPVVIRQTLEKQRLKREKEQARAALEESEERYRKLVELSPDGTAIHVEGRFVFINPAGTRILGAAASSELLGRSIFDFIPDDFREKIRRRLSLLQGGREAGWLEEKLIRPDGSTIDVEVAGVPWEYDGKPAVQVIFRDISERKRAELRLYELANFDTLTGLANRALFFERLERTLAQARRYGHRVALLYLDLDRFKEINDTLGHTAGDLLLKEAAQRMLAGVRQSDSVARLGGDEFAVILPEIIDPPGAGMVARRLLAALAEPFQMHGQPCRVGTSIGISLFPADGEDGEALLRKADSAMYAAKREGGDDFRFYREGRRGLRPGG